MQTAHYQKKLANVEHIYHGTTLTLAQKFAKNSITVVVVEILTISSPNWPAKINAYRNRPLVQVLLS